MYERMLDKEKEPNLLEIKEYISEDEYKRLSILEENMARKYKLIKELRFPFGNTYGWGYKYSHGSYHLCYVFFERNAFTVMLQIGDRQVAGIDSIWDTLSPKAKELWEHRYPCGDHGGWIQYRVLEDNELEEVIQLISVKKRPMKGRK